MFKVELDQLLSRRSCIQISQRIGSAANPGGRSDGNRKKRGSRALTASTVGIEVTTYRGPTGVGAVLADPVAGSVVEELVTRAKLEQETNGLLEARIRGRQMKFVVSEYDHFGETAFEIRMGT